nr:hypothetical protein [Moritella viscosa]SHO15774.1 Translation initiation factor IF-2 [Moritella viscosa]
MLEGKHYWDNLTLVGEDKTIEYMEGLKEEDNWKFGDDNIHDDEYYEEQRQEILKSPYFDFGDGTDIRDITFHDVIYNKVSSFEEFGKETQTFLLDTLKVDYREIDVECSYGFDEHAKLVSIKDELYVISGDGVDNIMDIYLRNPEGRYVGDPTVIELDNSNDEIAMFEMVHGDADYDTSAIVIKLHFENERAKSFLKKYDPVCSVPLTKEQKREFQMGYRYITNKSVKDIETLVDGEYLSLVLNHGKELTPTEVAHKPVQDLNLKFKSAHSENEVVVTTFSTTNNPQQKITVAIDPNNVKKPLVKGKVFKELVKEYELTCKDKSKAKEEVENMLATFSLNYAINNKDKIKEKVQSVKPEPEQKPRSKNRLTRG